MYVVCQFQVWLSHMVSSCFCMHQHLIYCWAHCWMDIFPSFNIWKQSGRFQLKYYTIMDYLPYKYLLRSLCMNIGFHCSGINTLIPWVVLVTRLTLIRNCRLGCDSVLECVPNIWDFLERERENITILLFPPDVTSGLLCIATSGVCSFGPPPPGLASCLLTVLSAPHPALSCSFSVICFSQG